MCAVIPGNCFLASSNLLGIAIAFGGSIAIFVYAAASFSGESITWKGHPLCLDFDVDINDASYDDCAPG